MNEEIIKTAMTPYIVGVLSKFIKPTETVKYLSRAKKVYGAGGFQKALAYLARTKDITRNIGEIPKYYGVPRTLTKGTRVGKGVRKRIGNVAAITQSLTKDVAQAGWHAPIIASKNLLSVMARNVRSTRYKTVPLAKATTEHIRAKGGKAFYGKFFPKKIVGATKGAVPGSERLLLRKSPIGQMAGVATSAPAFGYYTYLANKHKKMPARIGASVTDATLWAVAPTATVTGSILYDYMKKKNRSL